MKTMQEVLDKLREKTGIDYENKLREVDFDKRIIFMRFMKPLYDDAVFGLNDKQKEAYMSDYIDMTHYYVTQKKTK